MEKIAECRTYRWSVCLWVGNSLVFRSDFTVRPAAVAISIIHCSFIVCQPYGKSFKGTVLFNPEDDYEVSIIPLFRWGNWGSRGEGLSVSKWWSQALNPGQFDFKVDSWLACEVLPVKHSYGCSIVITKIILQWSDCIVYWKLKCLQLPLWFTGEGWPAGALSQCPQAKEAFLAHETPCPQRVWGEPCTSAPSILYVVFLWTMDPLWDIISDCHFFYSLVYVPCI